MAITARTEFAAALNQLASEKGVDVNIVIQAIEQAALAAYRKDLSLRGEEVPEDFEELVAKIDPVTGEISIWRGNDNITPPGFARIAAQTAKQVIMQRLHEAEKGALTEEYEKKVGTVLSGMIQRQEGNTYFVDLGRAEGVLPISEQTRGEYYYIHQRLKFYIKEIKEGKRGLEVVVSRSDPSLVKGLFAMEVPEVQTGAVVIKGIAREAGSRTKISAISTQEGADPVGSLVGQKGVRVQAVMNDLGEERVDIISYSDDLSRYVAAALSPAKDVTVKIEERDGEKLAVVQVSPSQLSLAIGKGGQNVRLAAKLTGIKIDIEGTEESEQESVQALAQALKTVDEQIDQGEQPMPTDETAQTEGRLSAQEGIEKLIDQATEQSSGALEPEPTQEENQAAEVAEADIAEFDKTKAQGVDLGSMDEKEDEERGSLIGTEKSDYPPTVANTSETPEVSPVEPPFPGTSPKAKEDKKSS